MSTDFGYNSTTIGSSGGFKPTKKNTPLDVRTVVEVYADIASIPMPFVGMTITVKADETNDGKMTDYKVISLKANVLDVADMLVNEVQRIDEYIGTVNSGSGSSDVDLTGYATEEYVDNAVAGVSVPTKTSELTNDSGFITSVPSEYVTESELTAKGYLTEHQDLTSYQKITDETLETTDKTVPGAINEINSDLGGKSFVYLTQAEYDALSEKDKNIIYGITDAQESETSTIDIVNEMNKLSLSINNSILSLIYDGTTISAVTLPTTSSGDGEDTEVFGNIVVSTTTTTLTEGNSTTFTVALDTAPTNSQVVNLSANNLYVMLDKDSLTFTAADYNTPQTVTVNAMSVDLEQTSIITVSSDNVSSKTITITVKDSSSTGSDTLTRDGLVYYLDFKDQNRTDLSTNAFTTTADTNTLFSSELTLTLLENTNNTLCDGNVIEGGVLKSSSTASNRANFRPVALKTTDFSSAGQITLETYAQLNGKPTSGNFILLNSVGYMLRANSGNDFGIYFITESNGSYGYFTYSSESVDYTQPHLFTATISQGESTFDYKLYVDGTLIDSGTKNGVLKLATTDYLNILNENADNKEIANIRVYNKVLTDDEVVNNYAYEQTIERTW